MKKKALTVALILTGFLAMGFLAGTTWSGYQINASAGTKTSNTGSRTRFPSSLSDMHIRKALLARNWVDSVTLNALPHGRRVRYAGIVICRQRPGTAAGVVFMTLEDEGGFVNLVIWSQVFEKHRILVKTARFLGVTGRLQSQHGVVHLVAESLWEPDIEMQPSSGGSRDFH